MRVGIDGTETGALAGAAAAENGVGIELGLIFPGAVIAVGFTTEAPGGCRTGAAEAIVIFSTSP